MTTAGQIENHTELERAEATGRPAFLWRPRDCAIVWANAAGLALWSAATIGELTGRRLDRAMPAVARLQRLALVLAPGAPDQQDFVFWLPDGSRSLACMCRKIHHLGEDGLLLQLVAQAEERQDGAFGTTWERTTEPGINGHAAPDFVLAPRVLGHRATPPERPSAVPPLGPQDAATLAEIARLIRQRSDGAGAPSPRAASSHRKPRSASR